MTASQHDWIVFHRVRFPTIVDAFAATFSAPQHAHFFRFGPSRVALDGDAPILQGNEWAGISVFRSREHAEAAVAEPQKHLEFVNEAEEHWVALLLPFTHRGEVNFDGTLHEDDAIKVADTDPDGPLFVITTAGFHPSPQFSHRLGNFLRGVHRVLTFFDQESGNICNGFIFAPDKFDGITYSIWKDDKSMMDTTYRDGVHKKYLQAHLKEPMFDRSSFTRARIAKANGSWNNIDLPPVK